MDNYDHWNGDGAHFPPTTDVQDIDRAMREAFLAGMEQAVVPVCSARRALPSPMDRILGIVIDEIHGMIAATRGGG